MKILVTGATGFLGSHVVEQLLQQGFRVKCLIRTHSDISFLKMLQSIEFFTAELHDINALCHAMSDVDAIIHCAALIKAREKNEFYNVNVRGTESLFQAAKRVGSTLQRVVLVSSLAAAGPAKKDKPHTEENLLFSTPISEYGRSKRDAEYQAYKFMDCLPITILRFPIIYGPRDKQTLLFFKAVKRGLLLLPLKGQHHLSVLYVVDAATALIQAIKCQVPTGQLYYLSDGTIRTWQNMLSELAFSAPNRMRLKIPLSRKVMMLAAFFAEQYSRITHKNVMLTQDKINELNHLYWTCENKKAQQDLAWKPQVNWEEGVKLTYTWYKNAGWL